MYLNAACSIVRPNAWLHASCDSGSRPISPFVPTVSESKEKVLPKGVRLGYFDGNSSAYDLLASTFFSSSLSQVSTLLVL